MSQLFERLLSTFGTGLAITLTVLVLAWLVRRFALARLEAFAKTTATSADDLAVHALGSIRWWGWLAIALWSGAHAVRTGPDQEYAIHAALVVVLATQLGVTLESGVAAVVVFQQKRAGKSAAATTIAAVGTVSRIAIFAVLVVVVLSNLGIEVSALAATLGIGGLAAALAVQNVLGDLFASLSIYLDRPFDLGDSIQVDQISGEVESISWRSTYVRSTTGEQVVFANSDLGRARIKNFRRLSERRALVTFRVPVDADADALAALPHEIQQVVDALDDVRFERAHLVDVTDTGLQFELVFWITRPDAAAMFDRKHAVIVALRRALDARSVSLSTTLPPRPAPSAPAA